MANNVSVEPATNNELPGQCHSNLQLQGGSNMTGTDLCVSKPHCAAAVRP